jgi:hypothetical protein
MTLERLTALLKRKHKVYRAILTQAGTAAPVATILENTLGTVGFSRDDVGSYLITSAALFTASKTQVFATGSITVTHAEVTSTSEIEFGTASDAWKASIEIRVYP